MKNTTHRLAALAVAALLCATSTLAQSCSSYSYSCSGCASAPSYLQCGWCQDTLQCLAGHSSGPNAPATCSSTSLGWGYGSSACRSPAAVCAQHTSCSTCATDSSGSCGWCESSQQCLAGSSNGPRDGSCWSGWSWYSSQCRASSDICNSYSSSCGTCASAPSSYACGWCSSTGTCQTGSVYGPTNAICAISSWSYQTCSCSSIHSCSTCVSSGSCIWCGDGDTQHSIGGGGGCFTQGTMTCPQRNLATTTGTCNAYPGSDPYPDAESTGKASTAQVSGMVLMSLSILLTLIGICLYSCVRTFRPVLGKNLRAAAAPGSVAAARDCTSCLARIVPLALLVVTVVLKSVAVGLDIWARFEMTQSGIHQTSHFGLLWVRVSALGMTFHRSYVDMCSGASGHDSANDHQLCQMVVVGGVLALISAIAMLVAQLMLVIFAFMSLVNTAHVTRHMWKSWRCSGLTLLFTLSALAQWLFGGYFALHHEQGAVRLGVSWILLTVSLLFDFLLILYYRSVIHASPDPRYGEVTQAVAVPQGVAPLISHAAITPAFAVYAGQPGGGMSMQPPGVHFSGYPVPQAGYAPVYATPAAVYMPPPANPQGFVAPAATNPAAYQPLVGQ